LSESDKIFKRLNQDSQDFWMTMISLLIKAIV